jgi:hypothetical protein
LLCVVLGNAGPAVFALGTEPLRGGEVGGQGFHFFVGFDLPVGAAFLTEFFEQENASTRLNDDRTLLFNNFVVSGEPSQGFLAVFLSTSFEVFEALFR